MSPAKFQQHQHNILNSLRPSPLKINKDSHLIHKLSSSTEASNSSSTSTSVVAPVGGEAGAKQLKRNHPVIIYTYSPKVIHTEARDFMALVQKLTGLSSSSYDETIRPTQQGQESGGVNVTNNNSKDLKAADSTDDKESILKAPKNSYLADIPLFTPNSVDFFCSPRPARRTDSAYASSSMADSISPSVLKFMKGLPEY